MAAFEKYQDHRQEWRWTFYADNGEAIAVSSEGYRRETDCDYGIQLVKKLGPNAQVRARASVRR